MEFSQNLKPPTREEFAVKQGTPLPWWADDEGYLANYGKNAEISKTCAIQSSTEALYGLT